MLTRFIARQLRRPHGWFGRLVMVPVLDRGNRELLEASLGALDVGAGHAVLDVGFGGGATLAQLLASGRGGAIVGVDLSTDMVRTARRRFAKAISEGRLRIAHGDVLALPFADTSFDRVLTVNTVYFWPDLDAALLSIARVLRPGGRLVVGFSGAEKMKAFGSITSHGFLAREPEDLESALRVAGFKNIRTRALDRGRTRGDHLALAER